MQQKQAEKAIQVTISHVRRVAIWSSFTHDLEHLLETEYRDSSIRGLGLVSHEAACSGLFAVVKDLTTEDWTDLSDREINQSFCG